jgi:hypothetical protein
MKSYILVFLFSFFINTFYAQLDYRGWKTWQSIEVDYKLNKKSKIEGVLSTRNRHALTTLDQLFIDLSYSRDIDKKQDISFAYRLTFENEEYSNQYVNRFNIDYSYKMKLISKHSLKFRNRIQAKFHYDNSASFVDRLRLKYTYKYSKKVDLSAYTEGFYELNQNILFYKYRIGSTLSYELYKRLKLGLKYFLTNEVNVDEPKSFNVFSISLKKTIK